MNLDDRGIIGWVGVMMVATTPLMFLAGLWNGGFQTGLSLVWEGIRLGLMMIGAFALFRAVYPSRSEN